MERVVTPINFQVNMEGEESTGTASALDLTEEQKKRIESNREKAKALRKKRIREKPYARPSTTTSTSSATDNPTTIVSSPKKPTPSHVAPTPPTGSQWDTYGGYILDDEQTHSNYSAKPVEEEAPPMPDERPTCEECQKKFAVSYLLSKFQLSVCDNCRDSKGKHSLITKTEAKQRFLLRDGDFEESSSRGPALSFILKKNPHSSRWGEMKLFLLCQVEERSHKIWGGEAGLEEEHQNKIERREKKKEKKYAKEIKQLRRAVRSSLVQSTSKYHEHSFPTDSESYDPDSDTWTKTCSECGYKVTFEKM